MPIYREYARLLNIKPEQVKSINQIPFLPVSFFKTHKIVADAGAYIPGTARRVIFTSSGTTRNNAGRSKHYVADVSLYEESFIKGFEYFYGAINQYCILALLPSYARQSSLIYMTARFIKESKHADSGFYAADFNNLAEKLTALQNANEKFILLGVTYALLDFAEYIKQSSIKRKQNFEGIIMETGGMKGQRKEMIRDEVHDVLCEAFGIKAIHSEYGMTELLSQAYSKGRGIFNTPPWMRILIRDVNDSAALLKNNHTGGINIIDLANVYSCAFIATQDLGKKSNDESFEVLGRFDNSDLRGCNLLAGE